jgi:hypothetical protein
MTRVLLVGVLLAASAAPADAESVCETFVLALWGKEPPETIRSGEQTLQFLSRNRPVYRPEAERGASDPPITWQPQAHELGVRQVGEVDGRRLFSLRYSPLDLVLVWESGDSKVCPALLLSGDAVLVAQLGAPDIFKTAGRDVATLRIYYSGMGALQESLFFAFVSGQLVHLEQESLGSAFSSAGLETHHRGGGFCKESLRWQNLGWVAADRSQQGVVRVQYRLSGRRLVVDTVELVRPGGGGDCGQYDEPSSGGAG